MTSVTYDHGHLDDFTSFWSSTTGTADSGSTTTTVDTERTEAMDYWNGYYIKYTSGDNAGEYKLITDFDSGTDTLTHLAFSNAVSAGDQYVLSSWKEVLHNMANGDATPSIIHDDYLKVEAVFDNGATNEYVYYEKDISNLSSDIYTRWLLRCKTSVSANGANIIASLVFTAGDPQTIVTDTYSTEWTVLSGTVTSGKTIDKIRVFANDDGTDGTFSVEFDFVLLHKGTFTFPNVGGGLEVSFPPRYAVIPVFGRVGDITQGGGSELATVRASCDLDIGNWKRTGDVVDGEVVYDISHNTSTEPWQWLDTGYEQFKATLETPRIRRESDGNRTSHILDLTFREYRLSDASNESYVERFGLNL